MVSTITINTIYNCSLERAFKTGFLGDVSKVHTGYGLIPKITHCTEDENWGKPGYSKKVFGLNFLFISLNFRITDTFVLVYHSPSNL